MKNQSTGLKLLIGAAAAFILLAVGIPLLLLIGITSDNQPDGNPEYLARAGWKVSVMRELGETFDIPWTVIAAVAEVATRTGELDAEGLPRERDPDTGQLPEILGTSGEAGEFLIWPGLAEDYQNLDPHNFAQAAQIIAAEIRDSIDRHSYQHLLLASWEHRSAGSDNEKAAAWVNVLGELRAGRLLEPAVYQCDETGQERETETLTLPVMLSRIFRCSAGIYQTFHNDAKVTVVKGRIDGNAVLDSVEAVDILLADTMALAWTWGGGKYDPHKNCADLGSLPDDTPAGILPLTVPAAQALGLSSSDRCDPVVVFATVAEKLAEKNMVANADHDDEASLSFTSHWDEILLDPTYPYMLEESDLRNFHAPNAPYCVDRWAERLQEYAYGPPPSWIAHPQIHADYWDKDKAPDNIPAGAQPRWDTLLLLANDPDKLSPEKLKDELDKLRQGEPTDCPHESLLLALDRYVEPYEVGFDTPEEDDSLPGVPDRNLTPGLFKDRVSAGLRALVYSFEVTSDPVIPRLRPDIPTPAIPGPPSSRPRIEDPDQFGVRVLNAALLVGGFSSMSGQFDSSYGFTFAGGVGFGLVPMEYCGVPKPEKCTQAQWAESYIGTAEKQKRLWDSGALVIDIGKGTGCPDLKVARGARPELATRIATMCEAALADGVRITGGGGSRTLAMQIATQANAGDLAAKPGRSPHEHGAAVDLTPAGTHYTPLSKWMHTIVGCYKGDVFKPDPNSTLRLFDTPISHIDYVAIPKPQRPCASDEYPVKRLNLFGLSAPVCNKVNVTSPWPGYPSRLQHDRFVGPRCDEPWHVEVAAPLEVPTPMSTFLSGDNALNCVSRGKSNPLYRRGASIPPQELAVLTHYVFLCVATANGFDQLPATRNGLFDGTKQFRNFAEQVAAEAVVVGWCESSFAWQHVTTNNKVSGQHGGVFQFSDSAFERYGPPNGNKFDPVDNIVAAGRYFAFGAKKGHRLGGWDPWNVVNTQSHGLHKPNTFRRPVLPRFYANHAGFETTPGVPTIPKWASQPWAYALPATSGCGPQIVQPALPWPDDVPLPTPLNNPYGS